MAKATGRARIWLSALLLITLLIVAACGGGEEEPTPEIPPTPTLIPTLPAPATPVPAATEAATEDEDDSEAEITDEPEAEDTEESDAAVAEDTEEDTTEEAAPDAEATEVATEEAATEDASTDDATPEATEEATTTDEAATPEADADSESEATAEPEATDEPEVTATEEVTGTEEVTATEAMTATEPITDSAAMTEDDHTDHGMTTDSLTTDALTTGEEVSLAFLQPTTNAVVPVTFTVGITYAGVNVATGDDHSGAGHIHLLIDSPFIEAGESIPSDDFHVHVVDGATTTELSLVPGSHTLRLQFAGADHTALEGDQYRQEIIVNVAEDAPAQAVRIAAPSSGATVPPTFTVIMAATGLDVEPAGAVREAAGHFHLLIDEPFIPAGEIIPADETHIHFGQAQTSAELTLEEGTYTLRLQYADGEHRALQGNQYRAEVEIIVAEDAAAEQVMFIKPADGATVTSPFLVGWAASGLIIEPAGAVLRPEGGHLHVLIDEEFIAAGEPIPSDETHLHFGKGQTSAELELEPGEYTLRLQMANGAHVAQDGAQYQDEITVTVR